MNAGLRIGIVGAGPGGLTLARVLQARGIEAAVFEREAFSSARPQGGSLDMHAESGQFAVEQAGLTAEFQRIARYEDQQMRVYDKHGTAKFVDRGGSDQNRPEVDRGQLRQMLLDSLSPGTIRWDHELVSATPKGELIFRNGAREKFDLIVGADGAWSRVRPLLSEAKPVYSGILFVEFGIEDADRRYPELARLVGRGLMFALGDRKALIGHRDANAHLGTYAALTAPPDWANQDSPARLKARVIEQFEGWSEDLLRLVREAEGSGTPRPIYALPVGHRWEHRPGVTVVGDAAHLMSPFSGEGANLAMQDGAELGAAIADAAGDWDAAVREFEQRMFARAEEAAAGARDSINDAFSEDGLEHMVRFMESLPSGEDSPSRS